MQKWISHSIQEETAEAKARWFQSLSLTERVELLCAYTNLIMEVNPTIVEKRDVGPVSDCIRILKA